MEYEKIEVGKPFTFKIKREAGDGAYFENLGNGMWLQTIYLENVSIEELRILKEGMPVFRYINNNDFILPLVNYGSDMIFEMEFDPTLYLKNDIDIKFDNLKLSNFMTMVLIDSKTNIVKAIRTMNIPDLLFESMMKCYRNAFEIENYSFIYKMWMNRIRHIELLNLWRMANDNV